MRNRQRLAKVFLIVTCLAMALCLVQRAVYLHHFLQEAANPISVMTTPAADDASAGPSPCQLSASSLLCAQPVFFDGALPAIILFMALIPLFTPRRMFFHREEPKRPPTRRIHLTHCVFRE